MGKIAFCENCRKDVIYSIRKEQLKNELKGTIFEYTGKVAICTECGKELYVSVIGDENLKLLYDAYREKNSIISLEKIIEIPTIYNIGKRPLSLLLGWGEMTFSRYCEGDIPSKQYSDILLQIYKDPEYYLKLLETNKGNLKSMLAYEKSKKATLDMIGNTGEVKNKIDHVLEYLLCKCEDITPLALQKALYYVQGFYYAFNGDFLFKDDCEAWVHGPVYREVYSRFSSYKYDPINNYNECDESKLSMAEKTIIDCVVKYICCYSGKTLEQFTHAELPWLNTRGDLHPMAVSNRIIEKKLIAEYFLAVKNKFEMLVPADIEAYSKSMFEKIK
ncbi:MAG: DUF4065 domain-containing protein [Clostridiales bacterium]|nr:DUF4065 domain-containing protein [Clostridiales bacterium]